MTGTKQTGRTTKTMTTLFNDSEDKEFNQLATELLSYDPLTRNEAGEVVGALKRVTTKAMGDYVANDIEESGSITIIGFENLDGDYIIQKIDATSGKSIRFGTIINNPTRTSYALAWTNRATLSYDTYSTAFTA